MYININKAIILGAGVLLLSGIVGCRGKNEAKERIQAEREKWEASLPDSLRAVERQTDSVKSELAMLTHRFDAMVHTFDYVENPREVEGYYIAGAWKASYPLKATGLVARITKGETLELIAALAGGAHFNRLRVEAGGETAETSVVPHDQALNYRMAGLNTVCFSDSAANSCVLLITRNVENPVTVTYLDGDKKTGSISYPAASRKTMEATWNLYEVSRAIHRNELMIPMLAKKGAILTQKIESLKKD